MIILEGVLTPRDTDTLFTLSPDAGHPDCICSRCGVCIQEDEMPVRVLTTNDEGEVDESSREYRYCEKCTTGKAFFNCSWEIDCGFTRCYEQCDDCKTLQL